MKQYRHTHVIRGTVVPLVRNTIWCALVCLVVATPAGAETSENEMMMVMGEQQVLDARDIASFSESTRGVIEVKVPRDGTQLIITAIRPGRTSLLLLTHEKEQKKIQITVFAQNPESIIKEMGRLLAEQQGITFVRMGPKVFVDGAVRSEAGLERVRSVIGLYPGQVQSLVQLGTVVTPRTNVRLDLVFLEVNTGDTLEGGIGWPASLGAGGGIEMSYDLVTGLPSGSYRVVDQAMPSIHAAQSAGFAKIKKRASLLTTNGNQATYKSGGEINIPIAGSQAAELRSISYGCTLTVLPSINLEKGIVDLEVEAEVSELRDTSGSAPGRTIATVKTLVHLGIGQSIILSGLDSTSSSFTKRGLPFLSRIPLVGMLFGRHRKHREQTNGLIAITPVVMDNPSEDHRRRIEMGLKTFNRLNGLHNGRIRNDKTRVWTPQ